MILLFGFLLLPVVGQSGRNAAAGSLFQEQSNQTASDSRATPATLLTSGSQIERAIKAGETHRYSIPATAGKLISLHLEADGAETTLAVTDPSGKEQDRSKSLSGPAGPVLLITLAETTGNYTARVSVGEGDVSLPDGRYRLFVELREPVERDRKFIAAQRATIAASDLFDKRDPHTATGFESAAAEWQGVGDKYNEGICLLMAGLTYRAMADSAHALKLYERALENFRASVSARMEAYTLNNIGVIYYSMENVEGALDKALEYESQALELMKKASDRRGQTLALMNLALAYVLSGQNDKASESLQRALPILTEIGDKAREANALNSLGGIYDSLAEPEKALESYRRALKLGEERRDDLVRARAMNNLGVVYSNLGDYRKALDYYNEAIPLLKDIAATKNTVRAREAKNTEATALDNVGFIQVEMGNLKEALNYFKLALDLHRSSGSPLGEATTLEDIGYANSRLNNVAEAASYYRQALELARRIGLRKMEASVLNKIGYLYKAARETQKALESFREALPIVREIDDTYKEAEALQGIATVKRAQGDLEGARQDIESALTAIESVRSRVTSRQLQASFLANSGEDAYEFYVDLLMQLDRVHPSDGYGALALQASERARARTLLDILAEAHADIRSGMDPNLLKEAQRIQADLNHKAQNEALPARTDKEKEQRVALHRQIEDLLSEYDQVQAEMRSRNPHYADLVAPPSLGLADIQKTVADPNTVLLEYFLGTSHSYLWSVTTDSFHSFELPSGEKLEAEARDLHSLLAARNIAVKFETPEEKAARVAKADSEYWTAAAKLSEEILGPAAAELGRKRLIIVAQGALQYIPFAALPDPSQRSSVEPLVFSHEVVTLPSASVLAVLRNEISNRRSAPKGVAVLADPVFGKDDPRVVSGERKYAARDAVAQRSISEDRPQNGSDQNRAVRTDRASSDSGVELTDIARLPHTRDEAEAILALVPRRESLSALGFDANLKTATSPALQQYRILHFATHGFIDSRHPQLSGIVLSLVNQQGEGIDGFLRLNEIYNLRLPADLVVLSGCETGLGEEIKGEGLIGLTRGFMYAGAPRVVVSLWDVSDRGTAEFMKLFYQAMLRRGLSPSRALQAAQVEALRSKQLNAPYYWAAFELQGDWK